MRAAQLKKAYDNYMKYLQGETDRQVNIGKGKARPETTALYVRPFSVELPDSVYAKVSGGKDFWTQQKTNFDTYTTDTLDTATGEDAIKLKGFRPAKLSIKTGINPTGEVKTSNVTKMKYLKYGGTSQSLPFGNKATITAEGDAFEAIRIKTGVAKDSKTTRVYWQREKY